MFKKIIYVVVITVVIFIIIGLFLPRDVHVERAIEIDRPATTVFTILNGFHHFRAWSPWLERDPDTIYQFSGPSSGAGARMSWSGDPRQVGSGWQEIIESQAPTLVRLQLDIEQQGRAIAYFDIRPRAAGATVTWGFDADLVEGQGFFGGLLARFFGLFFDRWIGADYEEGLQRLKAFAETLPGGDFSDLQVQIIDAEPLDILYVATGSDRSQGGFAVKLAAAYREITEFISAHSIEIRSQPMAITRRRDDETIDFEAAIPVTTVEVELTGNVRAGQSPSGRAACAFHQGSYGRMAPSYEKLAAYMAAHGLDEGRVSWEHYISDPLSTPVDEITTRICFLVGDGQ